MLIKGTAIKSAIKFFKKFYPEYYNDFLSKLDKDVKYVYLDNVIVSQWYELSRFSVNPILVYAKIINKDPVELAKKMGSFGADDAINGIYKAFLLITTPQYLMRVSSKFLKTYYKDIDSKIIEKGKNWLRWKITNYPDMNEVVEHRIMSYGKRALELTNCKNVTYKIEQSITKGADSTIVFFSWD